MEEFVEGWGVEQRTPEQQVKVAGCGLACGG